MNWRDLLLLFLLGWIAVTLIGAFQPAPGYMDADYYYATGLQLAAGRGFIEPFLWNYLDDPAGLPHPSHAYWMPLASLLAAILPALFGPVSWFAARLPFFLAAACLPPLTAALAFSLTSRRSLALTSGLLAVFSGLYLPFLATTDTFGLYMLFGGIFSLLISRASSSPLPSSSLPSSPLPSSPLPSSPLPSSPLPSSLPSYPLPSSLPSSPLPSSLPSSPLPSSLLTSSSSSPSIFSRFTFPFLLGLLVGLLHLSRADGLLWLLIACMAAIFVLPKPPARRVLFTFSFLLFTLLGYFLPMAPWFARNHAAFGAFLAPGGSKMLWLTHYDQIFSYPSSGLTFDAWWSAGLGELLRARLWALGLNAANTLTVQGGIFLFPLIVIGVWQMRRNRTVQLALLAWGMTLGVMTLVFPFAGARGGYFHSGAALQPVWWALAPLGLERVLEWGRARRGWDLAQARPFFTAALVGLAIFLTALSLALRLPDWGEENDAYNQISEYLAAQALPDDTVVIVANPPGFYLASGNPAIVVPACDPQTLLDLARRYQAGYLILEPGSVPAALMPVYENPQHFPGLTYLGEVEGARLYVIRP